MQTIKKKTLAESGKVQSTLMEVDAEIINCKEIAAIF